MRAEKISASKLKFFRMLCSEEQYKRTCQGKLLACGAMVGSSPCGLLLLQMEDGVARVEELRVKEMFRRRHIAMDLLLQIPVCFPETYRVELVQKETDSSAFFTFLEGQEGIYQNSTEVAVFRLNAQNMAEVQFPGKDIPLKNVFELEEGQRQKLLGTEQRDWCEEGCICHEKNGHVDAGILICKDSDGKLKLYHAFSSEESGSALLACIRQMVKRIREQKLSSLEIVCKTRKAASLFERLFPEQKQSEQRKTIYWYVAKEHAL